MASLKALHECGSACKPPPASHITSECVSMWTTSVVKAGVNTNSVLVSVDQLTSTSTCKARPETYPSLTSSPTTERGAEPWPLALLRSDQ
jgi:hypothetical protein